MAVNPYDTGDGYGPRYLARTVDLVLPFTEIREYEDFGRRSMSAYEFKLRSIGRFSGFPAIKVELIEPNTPGNVKFYRDCMHSNFKGLSKSVPLMRVRFRPLKKGEDLPNPEPGIIRQCGLEPEIAIPGTYKPIGEAMQIFELYLGSFSHWDKSLGSSTLELNFHNPGEFRDLKVSLPFTVALFNIFMDWRNYPFGFIIEPVEQIGGN